MGAVFAACGHDVFVGNAEFCDARGKLFDLLIHVHHERSPTPGRCKAFDISGAAGLFVHYVDGTSLATAVIADGTGVPLKNIDRFARQPGRILCHCAAGLCRGPTMAIIAKVARGCTPWQAMHDVANGMWLGYQQAPQLFNLPMTEICRWYWDGDRR